MNRNAPQSVRVRISGVWLTIPARMWALLEGPHPDPKTFLTSNGCTFSPDSWLTLRGIVIVLWYACWIHDWHYSGVTPLGGSWKSRKEADAILYRNLLSVALAQGAGEVRARCIAWLYWSTVRRVGAKAFNFAPGEKPIGRWQRFRESTLLFLARDDWRELKAS